MRKALEIQSIDKLREAAATHRLRELKGFGAKSEDSILRVLQDLDQSGHRVLMDEAKVWTWNPF